MRNHVVIVLFFFIGISAVAQEKTKTDLKWFKGNLHTHSLWSDGDGYPEMIIDWYKNNGYHFLALSDHNILAEGEKWIKVPKSKMYEDAFAAYLSKFGDEWVDQRIDSGRIKVRLKTYNEYKGLFESDRFLMIRSEEITDRFEGKPIHINATNVQELIPAQHGTSVVDVMQRNINAVQAQRESTGIPMFPHINHPNFYYAISTDDMIKLSGERFFEVYNGHPLVHNDGDSLRPSTEKMWDEINIAYAKRNQSLMMGLATDDSHNYFQFGRAYSNAGRGWIMVRSTKLDPISLINAMEDGDFYASTGVVLDHLSFENNRLRIRVQALPKVSYTIEVVEATNAGVKTTRIEGNEADILLNRDHLFVRAKVISNKLKENPFKDGEFEVAWTQPYRVGKF